MIDEAKMELNKIYCESNLETMARMPDGLIDLTVTSPPYDNLRSYKGYSFDFESVARELYRVTKKGGVVVWVVGDQTKNGSESGTSFRQALYFMECGFNLHDTMIYYTDKPPLSHNRYEQNFEYMFVLVKGKLSTFNGIRERKKWIDTTNRVKKWRREKDGTHDTGRVSSSDTKLKDNVWHIQSGTKDDKNAYQHPAIFPEKLAADHIYSWSNENDIVYDCFMGSGTTAKMAHLLNRKWIGSEISAEYVEIANKRLFPYLTQTQLFNSAA